MFQGSPVSVGTWLVTGAGGRLTHTFEGITYILMLGSTSRPSSLTTISRRLQEAILKLLGPSQKAPGKPTYCLSLFLKEISRTLCTVQVLPGGERAVIRPTHERPIRGRNKPGNRLRILQAHWIQLPSAPQNLPAAQVQWEDGHLQRGSAPWRLVSAYVMRHPPRCTNTHHPHGLHERTEHRPP